MNEKTVGSDASPNNANLPIAKTSNPVTGSTKMFILPPNMLQNIRISDSVAKGGSVASSIKLIKQNNTSNNFITKGYKIPKLSESIKNSANSRVVMTPTVVTETNKNTPAGDTNNEILRSVTKVPKVNKDKEKLTSKVSRIETKSSLQVIEKQEENGKIDKSATNASQSSKSLQKIKHTNDNVRNGETTSNDVPKPQKTAAESMPHSSNINLGKHLEKQKRTISKNKIDESDVLGRSKRIRKQTKFDDYVITQKKESSKKESKIPIERKQCTPNKKQKQLTIPSTISNTTEVNGVVNNKKSLKGILENMQNKNGKNDETAVEPNIASTSVTPAVTRKSLPLNAKRGSGDYSGVKADENNFHVKNLQDSRDVITDACTMAKDKDITEPNNKSDNKVYVGSMNTFLHEPTVTKQTDLEDVNTSDTVENSTDLTSIAVSSWLNQKHLILNTVSQSPSADISPITPQVRKRGRPRKTPIQQPVPSTSNESEENAEASQDISNISIAETVVHSKRHGEKSYNISSNDGLSDDNSSEDDTQYPFVVRKRGRPPGRGRVRGRGRGRGRGRARGRGRGSLYSTLDTEYIPKLKGPTTDNAKEGNSNNGTNIFRKPEGHLITCAKCEAEMPRQKWNSHNLLKHNNMGWRNGDKPIDFDNDIKLWRSVLMAALKKRKSQLICEKCGTIKRSANGFISHMQFCGKTDEEREALMMKCPVCGATMMPSSMEIHERVHRQMEQSKVKELELYTEDTGRVKRKAAEKAVTKILEFTELVKDDPPPTEMKLKSESSFLKSVIRTPEHKKTIPAVWKGIWKKELSAQGKVNCRQIGCTYTSSSFEDICNHSSKCNFIPQESYVCKICKFSTTCNEDMIKHVKEKHSAIEDMDQYSDFDDENYSSDENQKTAYTIKFLDKERMRKIRWTEPYYPTLHWTMEFEQKNYEFHLFNDCTTNHFTLLKNADVAKYLPALEVSMCTKKESASSEKSSNAEIPWKQWKRFEGGFDEGTATFFVGGPIWALAWLPIPSPMYSKEPLQYIAISTHPTMEDEYTVGKAYSGANIIQIWNVGPLNDTPDNNRKSPALSYAIAHNRGTIWCLEWCPSGCYQDESLNNYKRENEGQSNLKRMGMLAAACSDGNVHIYSLPFSEELKFEKTKENELPIYSTDPVITLVVNISMYDSSDQNWQCTKLSWSKEHGHNTIAAGFSNGYIALWDLTYKSPLSMEKRENTCFINAFQHFFAHGNAVSMVALVPYNGARFLASASLDRSYKFWDLENISSPQYCVQKGIIVDGAWMMHWPCAVITFDDALGYKHTNSYLIPLREHEFRYYPILATNSPTYALAVSDYGNSIAHGTLAGEILTIFPQQLVHSKEIDKAVQKKRKLSSFVKVVDFSENDSKADKDKKNPKDYYYMPETYKKCKDRFGIIFCDNLKNRRRGEQQTLHTEKLTPVPVEQYPFMSVNRISWNPNIWSYLWLAVGYQNGLVRMLSFKYMSMSPELKTWLPRHVECMLKKAKVEAEENR